MNNYYHKNDTTTAPAITPIKPDKITPKEPKPLNPFTLPKPKVTPKTKPAPKA